MIKKHVESQPNVSQRGNDPLPVLHFLYDRKLSKILFNEYFLSIDRNHNYWNIHQQFLTRIKLKWVYPTVHYLTLDAFPFTSEACLVIVDNHLELDLPAAMTPIALRTPHPVIVSLNRETYDGQVKSKYYTILTTKPVAGTLLKYNDSLAASFNITCTVSPRYAGNYLFAPYHILHVCLELIETEFALNVRPWQCQLHIGMFPPLLHSEEDAGYRFPIILQLPKLFKDKTHLSTEPNLYPSVRPLNLLIIERESYPHDSVQSSTFVAKWLEEHPFSDLVPIRQQLFLLLTLNLKQASKSGVNYDQQGLWKMERFDVAYFKHCPEYYNIHDKATKRWKLELRAIERVPKSLSDVSLSKIFPGHTAAQNWRFPLINARGPLLYPMLNYMIGIGSYPTEPSGTGIQAASWGDP